MGKIDAPVRAGVDTGERPRVDTLDDEVHAGADQTDQDESVTQRAPVAMQQPQHASAGLLDAFHRRHGHWSWRPPAIAPWSQSERDAAGNPSRGPRGRLSGLD